MNKTNIELEILYENEHYIVCVKPSGVTSEDTDKPGMPSLLSANNKIFTVHRLDREVGGVMVYAKDAKTASCFSKQITEGIFKKEYVAVVEGDFKENGLMCDLLYHDRFKNKTYVVNRKRAGVKEAKLEAQRVSSVDYQGNTISLVRVKLLTGRTHQIRVQFGSRKFPVLGDRKYGSSIKGCFALLSHCLTFFDPNTNELKTFKMEVPNIFPWNLF